MEAERGREKKKRGGGRKNDKQHELNDAQRP